MTTTNDRHLAIVLSLLRHMDEKYRLQECKELIRTCNLSKAIRPVCTSPDIAPALTKCKANVELRYKIREYFLNRESAEGKWGRITDWDTTNVTDMSNLFRYETTFNVLRVPAA